MQQSRERDSHLKRKTSCGAPGERADTLRTHREQDRHRRLASLLPLWPDEISDTSPSGRARLIALLERALRVERRRGLAGDWTYDLARHAQLLEAYREEMEALGRTARK